MNNYCKKNTKYAIEVNTPNNNVEKKAISPVFKNFMMNYNKGI